MGSTNKHDIEFSANINKEQTISRKNDSLKKLPVTAKVATKKAVKKTAISNNKKQK